MVKYGIDVCSYQGNIDWKRVKKAGCTFAVLKCIRKDLNPDTAFARNVAGCRANGIPVSVYTYVYENTVAGTEKRAKAAVKACQKQGVKGCVIWWDVEDKSIRKTGVDNRAKLTKSILAARAIITAAGYGFGVYCDADFYTGCLNANHIKGRWWIAAYHGNPVTAFGKAPAYKKPTIANELCGWQYCSRGRVPGISGSVDLDVAYDSDFTEGSVTATQTTSATGNPYPAPTITVASNETAAYLHLQRWIAQGDMVRAVQWHLVRLGYDIGASGIDGKMGKKTTAAVIAFQKGIGITPDGAVGSRTWPELDKATSKPAAPKATQASAEKQKDAHDSYRERPTVSNQKKLASGAKEVFGAVVKYGCRHQSGATTLAEIIKKKITTCSSSVTASLKLAGLMKKGKVGHTKPDGHGGKTKTTLQKAMYGLEHLDLTKFEVKWFFKKFKDLPEEWKEAGIVYVQDSNIDISAGNGEIFANNEGHDQMKDGRYIKTKVNKGYPITHDILFALKPKG